MLTKRPVYGKTETPNIYVEQQLVY